jgi:hypothetical protein
MSEYVWPGRVRRYGLRSPTRLLPTPGYPGRPGHAGNRPTQNGCSQSHMCKGGFVAENVRKCVAEGLAWRSMRGSGFV